MSTYEKSIVGYVKTHVSAEAGDIQESMILRYCQKEGIFCDKIYRDDGFSRPKVQDMWRGERIGISVSRYSHSYAQWEKMLLRVIDGKIGTILVDNKVRLYSSDEQKQAFEKICIQYQVKVIEVSTEHEPDVNIQRVAIYHFTDQAERRPTIVLNDMDRLYEYASRHGSWEVEHLYLDFSLNKCEQIRLSELVSSLDRYDIILVKSFYHINKKMMSFWKQLQKFRAVGICIVSLDEGELVSYEENELFEKSLKIAVYDKARSPMEERTQKLLIDRIRVFIKHKAKTWHIVKIYTDSARKDDRKQLHKLMEEADQFDLILMDTYGKVHEGTNQFYKFKSKVNLPLYSLREGGVL